MATPASWQSSFVAATLALGDTLAEASAALDADGLAAAAPLVTGLGHVDRAVRARVLAAALGRIVIDVDAMRIA